MLLTLAVDDTTPILLDSRSASQVQYTDADVRLQSATASAPALSVVVPPGHAMQLGAPPMTSL
jgi:hypothetical protein